MFGTLELGTPNYKITNHFTICYQTIRMIYRIALSLFALIASASGALPIAEKGEKELTLEALNVTTGGNNYLHSVLRIP
jgi:hypothetical protein